ncbi:hypothetical protein LINGRAPRIM_LOCUS2570, partial [Linum grandiflorum]
MRHSTTLATASWIDRCLLFLTFPTSILDRFDQSCICRLGSVVQNSWSYSCRTIDGLGLLEGSLQVFLEIDLLDGDTLGAWFGLCSLFSLGRAAVQVLME